MVNVRVDTRELNEALRRYSEVSRRTLPEICNKKALFISRRALWATHKTDPESIRSDLGRLVPATRLTKTGKTIATKKLELARGSAQGNENAPLAALILHAQLGMKGRPEESPFKGKSLSAGRAAMTKAIRKFIAARLRSIAYLASGWLPAIKTLSAIVTDKRGQPYIGSSVKQVGRPKGEATPALEGWRPVATISNEAGFTDEQARAMGVFGEPALAQAFEEETADTLQETERRMKESAHTAGIRTN